MAVEFIPEIQAALLALSPPQSLRADDATQILHLLNQRFIDTANGKTVSVPQPLPLSGGLVSCLWEHLLDKCPKEDRTADEQQLRLFLYECVQQKDALGVLALVLLTTVSIYFETPLYLPLLHDAVLNSSPLIVEILIKSGFDMNYKEIKNGNTPLHLAVCHRVAMVGLLVRNGVDVNAQNNEGETPLHIGCYFLRVGVVKYLLYYHADVNLLQRKGLIFTRLDRMYKDLGITKGMANTVFQLPPNSTALVTINDFLDRKKRIKKILKLYLNQAGPVQQPLCSAVDQPSGTQTPLMVHGEYANFWRQRFHPYSRAIPANTTPQISTATHATPHKSASP